MDPEKVTMPVAKAATAIGAAATAQISDTVGAVAGPHIALLDLTWPNLASAAAAIYTFCLILEWWWKRFWRPLAESRGWIKPKKQRKLTAEEINQILADRESTDYR